MTGRRVIVFGAGAVGSVLAARWARAGADVTVVARGAHVAAIRAGGLTVLEPDGTQWTQTLDAAETLPEARPGDLLLVTMKAHAQPRVAAEIGRWAATGALPVFVQNGVPWWYFRDLDGPFRDRSLDLLDPGGGLAAALAGRSFAGAVIYCAAEVEAPGRVRHHQHSRLVVGHPDGRPSAALADLVAAAGDGFTVETPGDPRPAVWAKLTANLAFNIMAVLTQATLGRLMADDATFALGRQLTKEALAVAAAVGCPITVDLDARRVAGRRMIAFKSSTLQDLEAGRKLELDALIGAVAEMARLTNTATPMIDAMLALARTRADVAGLLVAPTP